MLLLSQAFGPTRRYRGTLPVGEGMGSLRSPNRTQFVISSPKYGTPCAWKALQLVTVGATHGYEPASIMWHTAPARRTSP